MDALSNSFKIKNASQNTVSYETFWFLDVFNKNVIFNVLWMII
jgi:hypothetical protein